MPSHPFKLTIHMVSSLDGFIAKRDNSVSWFDTVDNYEQGVELTAQETAEFLKAIDCYVMGSGTYELALELSKAHGWPYGNVPVVVLTSRDLPVNSSHIELYSGDLEQLVNERLKPAYQNVWLVGGAMAAKAFINSGLADEIRQTILPIILGDGLHFYDQVGREHALHLKNVTAYKNGVVELHYVIKK